MTYKITDYNEEEIQGSFNEQELQNTSQSTFRIEKVLKRQGDKFDDFLSYVLKMTRRFLWLDIEISGKKPVYRFKHILNHLSLQIAQVL